jgi:hypothetical protein
MGTLLIGVSAASSRFLFGTVFISNYTASGASKPMLIWQFKREEAYL